MATATDPHQGAAAGPPRRGFRPSMLLSDTRYRGYTFQLIALIALAAGIAWLISNAVTNLANLGQNISWEFLGDPAGYDINQQPIPFSSQDTHLRAAVVGVLNTLVIAVLGCVTATILGVIAGVLRLSRNWLVSKLMAAYVEAFRNVPVLIWIVIFAAITANAFPAPSAFRGEDPDASMLLGSVALTNRGVYVPKLLTEPLGWVVLAVALASVIGVFLWRRHARRQLYDHGREVPVLWPALAILIVPPVLAYLVLGRPLGLEFPELMGFNFQGGLQLRGSLIALWLALSVYTAAFIAENVRAGILAVSGGQTEAAASLGLRPGRIMSLVVLPQALRIIIPPLISQFLNLTKNSSLAIAVGYMDLTGTLGGITLNQTGRAIECVLLLMLFYLLISLAISAIMNAYNSAVALKER